MRVKHFILGSIVILLVLSAFFINKAKNEYLKDQIFIEINKNVSAKTNNRIKTEIEEIQCVGYIQTKCEVDNINFYSELKKGKADILQVEKITGDINFLNMLLNKVENKFYIKNFKMDDKFLKEREFNPMIDFDTQEIISVLRKYGGFDVDFYFSKDNINSDLKIDVKLKNELYDFELKTNVVNLNTNQGQQQNELFFKNTSLVINKKDFDKKFFAVLKEREPSYFKKYSEDFIFKTIQSKYKNYIEDLILVDLTEIEDFFYKDNQKLKLFTKENQNITLTKNIVPFFTHLQFGLETKRDFKEELLKMGFEYSLINTKK